MANYSIKDVKGIISAKRSAFNKLLNRSDLLAKLNTDINSALPNNLKDKCKAGNIDNNELTLITPSSAIATGLRYHSEEILRTVNNLNNWRFIKIRIKIAPTSAKIPPCRKSFRTVSENARKTIMSQASSIEHTGLQQALANLANTCRNKK